MYRNNPKYDPEFHPVDLMKRMDNGDLNTQVFAAWKISKKTFYLWLKEHQDLAAAYEIGMESCEAWWINEMRKKWQKGDEKGFKYCALIVNTKFGYRENQNPSVTNNTQVNIQNMNVLQDKSSGELFEILQDKLKMLQQYTDVEIIDEPKSDK